MSLRRRKRTSNAILEIVDADGAFDLIPWLIDWTPARAGTKGGGVWQSGIFSDGRQPILFTRDNVVDTFELAPWDYSQDNTISQLQTLGRKLESARNYWTGASTTPVYIRARGSKETNIRYAAILDYSIPQDDNPFAQPFFSAPTTVMQDFSLIVEHGAWQDNIPGSSTCMQVNNLESHPADITVDTFLSTQNEDDAYVNYSWRAIVDNTGNSYTMGYNVNPYGGAVRFRSVTIPQGATIHRAFVRYTSVSNYSTVARLRIYVQNSVAPAALSDYADFLTRTFPASPTVGWIPTAWTTGTSYDTPDISALIQYIVDKGTWVSGNDLLIYTKDDPLNPSDHPGYRNAASYEYRATYDPAQLIIYYSTTTEDFGREDTCENEVYVTSRHTRNQVDTVKFYDDSTLTMTTRTIGGALPYDITAVVPEDDDILYFGISTANANAGPFCGLVFCLTDAMTGVTDAEWQYWDGAAWQTLDLICDNTSGPTGGGIPLQLSTGAGLVNSVHWEVPDDWEPLMVDLVNAWYVRVYVTTGGAGGKKVTQDQREVYALTTPYVDVAAANVTGDLPSLLRIKAHIQSANDIYSTDLYLTNLMISLRAYARGENFSPYINMSNAGHNANGIEITATSPAALTANSQSPSGYSLDYTPVAANDNIAIGNVRFLADITEEYYGRYRCFIRCRQVGGAAGDLSVRIAVYTGNYVYSDEVPTNMHDQFDLLDMGIVNVIKGTSLLRIYMDVSNTNASPPDLVIYDLILMPIDEWSGEFYEDASIAWNAHYFDIDSVSDPKQTVYANIRNNDDDSLFVPLLNKSSGEIILQPGEHQRLWFLAHGGYMLGDYYRPYPEVSFSVEIEAVKRYLSMRGQG